jgi:hypothetical protein
MPPFMDDLRDKPNAAKNWQTKSRRVRRFFEIWEHRTNDGGPDMTAVTFSVVV